MVQESNFVSTSIDCNDALLSVTDLKKIYGRGEAATHALCGLTFNVCNGEFVGVMGSSGSGKSTLLNCISTIDVPTSGKIVLGGQNVCTLRSSQLSKFRRENIGFIFQNANLIETLTGAENIALALSLKGVASAEIESRVQTVASTLGVSSVLDKMPNEMSGGERQRVSAARAIVGDPKIILADEPTGALDSKNTTILLETLEHINKSSHSTILMVTHDAYAAGFTDRTIFLKDGKIFCETTKGSKSRKDYYKDIVNVLALLGSEA